jgi:hypothetical protein
MKTALFSPSYLVGKDPSGSDRLERTNRWIRYYAKIQTQMGFQNMFLSDDGSPAELLDQLEDDPWVFEHPHLGKRGNGNGVDYDYCWRALWDIRKLIELGYQKILTIDTDTFVLNWGLADYIRSLNTGWTAFEIKKYKFPSAELHILCEDAFPRYLEYTNRSFLDKSGVLMERDIPFTNIICTFDVDRYGEDRIPQNPKMDAASKVPVHQEIHYVPRTPPNSH